MENSKISIVIPVYNEEAILAAAVHDLIARLPDLDREYELIIAENGSRDKTIEIAQDLSEKHEQVITFSASAPDYGLALREGIDLASGEFVICDEIDICDVDFYKRALERLETGEADLVVGSKVMKGADDRRPLGRRAATRVINGLLRVLLGFKGTDTHGLKAFKKSTLIDTAHSCLVNRDLFASEFVIRAQRGGINVLEIPVSIMEKRPPSIDLTRRVPAVIKGLVRLFAAIRLGV